MTTKELMKAFEAVLFASGEPLNIDRFAQVFEITPSKTIAVMDELMKKYDNAILLFIRKDIQRFT